MRREARAKAYVSLTDAAAFTLIELIAVVVITLCLVMAVVANWRQIVEKIGEARCMANMRAITVGLHGHLQDHANVWPQGPSPAQREQWESFWLNALEPYDVTAKTWQCPTFEGQLASAGMPREERPKIYYTPTMFPDTPGIATRWATHPWLIERGNAHGQGALICFPDGSIKSFNKVLAEMGVR